MTEKPALWDATSNFHGVSYLYDTFFFLKKNDFYKTDDMTLDYTSAIFHNDMVDIEDFD